jgi:hypothetical protein
MHEDTQDVSMKSYGRIDSELLCIIRYTEGAVAFYVSRKGRLTHLCLPFSRVYPSTMSMIVIVPTAAVYIGLGLDFSGRHPILFAPILFCQ